MFKTILTNRDGFPGLVAEYCRGRMEYPLLWSPEWTDATTPRTERPVRFVFYWSGHNRWHGFPDAYQVPRLRA
jgi:hypothetical protein